VSKILETLLAQAQNNVSKIDNPAWVDSLMRMVSQSIAESDLPDELKVASQNAVSVIVQNKSKVANLSSESLTLMIQHLASGNSLKAVDVYITANTDPNALIALMNSTTNGVLRAKKHLDQLHKDALNLLKEIAIAGARAILPFLLTLL